MRRVSLAVVVSFLSLHLSASASRANLIEFTFNGSVTSVQGLNLAPLAHPLQSAAAGDSFSLTYVFESFTADTNGTANTGSYVAIQSASVSVGLNLFEYDSFINRVIHVGNDSGGTLDFHQSNLSGSDASGNRLRTFLGLTDQTANVFISDALPSTLDLSDFNLQVGSLELPFDSVTAGERTTPTIRFQVDSVTVSAVPLPGAVVLALIGLPMVAWLRRRVS